jgi:hypothetical protein
LAQQLSQLLQHSSKRTPCPVCQRDKDDKCRWNDNVILCYYGEDFHPPSDLLLNSRIRINGLDWKLIKTSAGFSGGSYCFVSGESFFNPRALSRVDKERFAIKSAKVTDGFSVAFTQLRKLYQEVKRTQEFDHMNIDEFRRSKLIALKTIARAKALHRFLRKNRAILGWQGKYKVALEVWEKEAQYMLCDFNRFEKVFLGG